MMGLVASIWPFRVAVGTWIEKGGGGWPGQFKVAKTVGMPNEQLNPGQAKNHRMALFCL